jgi:hypothetical protein
MNASTTNKENIMKTTINLTPQQFNDWLAALRSGEYKQGRGTLCNAYDNSYCCLGVLCETNKLEKDESDSLFVKYLTPNGKVESGVYPDYLVDCQKNPVVNMSNFPELVEKYKINESESEYCENSQLEYALAQLNYKYGVTFEDLATIIEASFTPLE